MARKVHRCIDLNPLQFFRVAPAAGARGDDGSAAAAAPGGRKGMPKVPSLLFDIELEDGSGKADTEEAGVEEVQRRLKFLGRPWSDCEQQLMRQVAMAREEAAAAGRPLEADSLAERLRCLGHSVTVRTALGGGGGGECLRNLRHTFLSCAVHGSTGSVNYLVDPKFREQFEIAHASPRYAAVLAAAPADFVGTEERIVPLVELMCAEMSAAFRAAGATLPPWRQAGAMLSKWRPRRSEDAGSKVPPPAGAAAGARTAVVNLSAAAGGLPMGPPLTGMPPGRGPPAVRRYSMGGPAGADWRGMSRELSRARAVAARSSSLLAAELEAARKLCQKAAAEQPPADGRASQPAGSDAPRDEPGAPARPEEVPKLGGTKAGAAKASTAPQGGVFAELRRRAGEVGELSSAGARQMLTGF